MNAPYIPSGGLMSRVNRQWARFAGRAPLSISLDHAIVSFSFDDFPKSAATIAAPALEQRDWRATYYAAAGFAGGETHHGAMFDTADLHRLTQAGHEIGCHTYGHIDCATAALADIMRDVERNARALSAMGYEGALDSFAFPYGEARPEVKRALGSRFSTLRGVRAQINRGNADRHLLNAIPLDGGEAGIQRAVEAAEALVHHPGWLVYYGHDVQDSPTEWGCTPEQFDHVCDAVERSGARVLPVADALRCVEETA